MARITTDFTRVIIFTFFYFFKKITYCHISKGLFDKSEDDDSKCEFDGNLMILSNFA